MDTLKKCNFCGEEKALTEFYASYKGAKCKTCFLQCGRIYKKNRRSSEEFNSREKLKYQERKIRLWANVLLNYTKGRKIENNLEVADILNLYEKQNGLCYWYKIPLKPSLTNKHPQQPSIDRLDRNKGYVKDNIVLSCYAANIGRNESDLETWNDFIELLNNNHKNHIGKNDEYEKLKIKLDLSDDRDEYVVYDETLNSYTTKNINEFFRQNDLGVKNVNAIRKKSKRNIQKGVIVLNRTKGETIQKRVYHLISPENVKYKLFSLRSFCKQNNLNDSALQRLAKKEINYYKGWQCEYETITLK